MSKHAHTPGPWVWVCDKWFLKDEEGQANDPKYFSTFEGELPRIEAVDGSEQVMSFGDCTQYYPTSGCEPNPADRLLIAAAPDLLEALENLVSAYGGSINARLTRHIEQWENASSAIALATEPTP